MTVSIDYFAAAVEWISGLWAGQVRCTFRPPTDRLPVGAGVRCTWLTMPDEQVYRTRSIDRLRLQRTCVKGHHRKPSRFQ